MKTRQTILALAAASAVGLGNAASAAPADSPGYADDYRPVSRWDDRESWGPYNLHDPTLAREGDEYWMFSSDVSFGGAAPRGGILTRRSRDLVNWEFVGFAFDGVPEAMAAYVAGEQKKHGERDVVTPTGIWAPYALRVGDEFRLYYSVSVFGRPYSAIGYARSAHLRGPWEDMGMVVASTRGSRFNAIDPSVAVEPDGRQWLIYGSWTQGIAAVELNPETGKRLRPDDPGTRIMGRGIGGIQGLEAPEIHYDPELGKYFLFVSYDELMFRYNVRVAVADRPEGPYTDYRGRPVTEIDDCSPMILHPYRFDGHPGWQGTGHCGVFRDGDKTFLFHQGRLSASTENDNSIHLMVLHLREVFKTPDGWPVVSPERYAAVPPTDITPERLVGTWEHLVQVYRDTHNRSSRLTLSEQAEILTDGKPAGTYSFDKETSLLTLRWGNGFTDTVRVADALDWERPERAPTLVYTGLNGDGTAIWGKKRP